MTWDWRRQCSVPVCLEWHHTLSHMSWVTWHQSVTSAPTTVISSGAPSPCVESVSQVTPGALWRPQTNDQLVNHASPAQTIEISGASPWTWNNKHHLDAHSTCLQSQEIWARQMMFLSLSILNVITSPIEIVIVDTCQHQSRLSPDRLHSCLAQLYNKNVSWFVQSIQCLGDFSLISDLHDFFCSVDQYSRNYDTAMSHDQSWATNKTMETV